MEIIQSIDSEEITHLNRNIQNLLNSMFPWRFKEFDFDPVSGEELQTLAKTVVNQPPQVIKRLKKILGN